jgi:single-strand DNA-binding protein
MNSITVCGRITRDPEVRKVGDKQTSVCNFSIADNYYNQGEQTNFWDCVVWGVTAENLAKYCKKGSYIIATGEGQTEKWKNKEGEDRKTLRIQVRNLEFGPKTEKTEKSVESSENPGVTVDGEIPW